MQAGHFLGTVPEVQAVRIGRMMFSPCFVSMGVRSLKENCFCRLFNPLKLNILFLTNLCMTL